VIIKRIIVLFLCLVLSDLSLAESLPIDLKNEIEQVDEFPISVDLLEEFIQSYYALLESDEYLKGFSFLNLGENVISGQESGLNSFLNKMMELRCGLRSKVTIFQFGDSHIKPGFLSTTTRSLLLKYFVPETLSTSALDYEFIGVNGGSFQNLLENPNIFQRCSSAQPDLIIISLGTNDAQGKYNADRFKGELNVFMNKLTGYAGSAEILFTLPPATYKKGRHNADVPKVSEVIMDYAKLHQNSYWDLAEVMGGRSSILKWRNNELASQDLIHFSPKGYMLQGYLLYAALMHAYKEQTEKGR
jgi:lysophospholipase L1-like esterase